MGSAYNVLQMKFKNILPTTLYRTTLIPPPKQLQKVTMRWFRGEYVDADPLHNSDVLVFCRWRMLTVAEDAHSCRWRMLTSKLAWLCHIHDLLVNLSSQARWQVLLTVDVDPLLTGAILPFQVVCQVARVVTAPLPGVGHVDGTERRHKLPLSVPHE